MAISPTAGRTAKCTVGSADVPGTNWRLSVDAHLKDVSNFKDGRLKVATLNDATLTIDLIWDSAAEPTAPSGTNIRTGSSLAVTLYTDNAKSFSGTFIVGTVEAENPGLEDVVLYHVTGNLVGDITYPL